MILAVYDQLRSDDGVVRHLPEIPRPPQKMYWLSLLTPCLSPWWSTPWHMNMGWACIPTISSSSSLECSVQTHRLPCRKWQWFRALAGLILQLFNSCSYSCCLNHHDPFPSVHTSQLSQGIELAEENLTQDHHPPVILGIQFSRCVNHYLPLKYRKKHSKVEKDWKTFDTECFTVMRIWNG